MLANNDLSEKAICKTTTFIASDTNISIINLNSASILFKLTGTRVKFDITAIRIALPNNNQQNTLKFLDWAIIHIRMLRGKTTWRSDKLSFNTSAIKSNHERGLDGSQELGLHPSQELGPDGSQELGLHSGQELGLDESQELGLHSDQELGLDGSHELGPRISSGNLGKLSSDHEGLITEPWKVDINIWPVDIKNSDKNARNFFSAARCRAARTFEIRKHVSSYACVSHVARCVQLAVGFLGSGFARAFPSCLHTLKWRWPLISLNF